MSESVLAFYDDLAGDYHLLFADWQESVRRQAAVLDRLIRSALGPGPHAVRDAACGIGTQAIGLALLGHRVHATDLSPAAIERARREAVGFGASPSRLTFAVADIREPATGVERSFDVVLACDNVLPHLLTDDDLHRAIANLAALLRPGGLFLASIRDYDRLIQDRPRGEGPRVFDGSGGRRISFQVWDWSDDGRGYRLHQFLVREEGTGWRTDHFSTKYRALLRHDLAEAARGAGLTEIRWQEPEESGYHQPIVTARRDGSRPARPA